MRRADGPSDALLGCSGLVNVPFAFHDDRPFGPFVSGKEIADAARCEQSGMEVEKGEKANDADGKGHVDLETAEKREQIDLAHDGDKHGIVLIRDEIEKVVAQRECKSTVGESEK
jgi:hypothetical protein